MSREDEVGQGAEGVGFQDSIFVEHDCKQDDRRWLYIPYGDPSDPLSPLPFEMAITDLDDRVPLSPSSDRPVSSGPEQTPQLPPASLIKHP